MKTQAVAEWILDAPPTLRSVFDATLCPSLSNLQMAERIGTLAAHDHFRTCPWQVRMHLINPQAIDWREVCRLLAVRKGA